MFTPNKQAMLIYNLFPTLAGTFSNWSPHICRAAQMGFNWIFVNPIQMPGLSGSLYSIKDYYAFNPLLSDPGSPLSPEQQLREALNAARDKGMRVMIDLVMNHTAIDSPLTKEHPGWFRHDRDGGIAHPYAMDGGNKVIWGDLARLDHAKSPESEALYQYFRSFVQYLLGLGFSGFRCDAAYQIPQKLWKRLISDSKSSFPEAIFAAETLGCSREQTMETAEAGFDYIFNSSKWWDYKSPWLMEQYRLFREICPSISFPESHDTERLAEEFHGDIIALRRAYLFSALFSAGIMIPMGFELGFVRRLHVVDTRPSDWESTDMDISTFIAEVNRIKSSCEAFITEAPTRIYRYERSRKILIIEKQTDSEVAVAAINIDLKSSHRLLAEDLSDLLPGTIKPLKFIMPGKECKEVSNGVDYTLDPGNGIIFMGRVIDDQ
ncbi:alpha-amylase family glycosyl hydrolase [Nitrospirota bacterium]